MSDWKVEADRLRAEGLSIREIAVRVGMAHATVGEHFKPHYCACGNRRSHSKAQCMECFHRGEEARKRERLQRVASMYNAGVPLREIARVLGRSVDAGSKMRAGRLVGQDVHEARAAGLITGYRVPEGDRRRSA